MAQVEQDIIDAGAQLIWVLEQNTSMNIGTAVDCRSFMDERGSTQGWCVGDGMTMPVPGTFDDSPFSIARGFDMIVVRETMTVAFSSSHGTPNGNENLTGEELLAEVEAVIAGLP
ncbi:MAG: hypothetical protein AAGF11_44920 [Myxococcota bacterium]